MQIHHFSDGPLARHSHTNRSDHPMSEWLSRPAFSGSLRVASVNGNMVFMHLKVWINPPMCAPSLCIGETLLLQPQREKLRDALRRGWIQVREHNDDVSR